MDAQFKPLQQSPEVVALVNSYFEIAVDFLSSSDILAALLRACYELCRMMVRVMGRVRGCLVGPTPAM